MRSINELHYVSDENENFHLREHIRTPFVLDEHRAGWIFSVFFFFGVVYPPRGERGHFIIFMKILKVVNEWTHAHKCDLDEVTSRYV